MGPAEACAISSAARRSSAASRGPHWTRCAGCSSSGATRPAPLVFREGEQGGSMYVIHSGELLVCHERPGEPRIKLMRLRPGDFFGEMTLIEIQPRSASPG